MDTTIVHKFVKDNRKPILVNHSEICFPPAIHQYLIDRADTSYPGIVIKYPNGYQLEDGVHRIAKLQRQGIYQSLFYVVSIREYYDGVVCMKYDNQIVTLGEWCNNALQATHH